MVAWPPGDRSVPDACESAYTWLARSAIWTAANTEAKLLMLTTYSMSGECCASAFIRNQRSRAALERIGGLRRNSASPPNDRRLHPWRLGAVLDCGSGVASG